MTGWICWINGPYIAGDWPDVRISRDYLVNLLPNNERVLSDGGYPGAYHLRPDHGRRGQPMERLKAKARARHETINSLFKQFGCLLQRWRHPEHLHAKTFWAVVNLTQLKIRFEGVTWQVADYRDRQLH